MPERFHRLTLRVPSKTYEALRERAERSHVAMAELGRRGLEAWLLAEEPNNNAAALEQLTMIGLATLVAAEHTVRFLGRTFPDGERRLLELRESAVDAAERRLDEVSVRLGSEPQA